MELALEQSAIKPSNGTLRYSIDRTCTALRRSKRQRCATRADYVALSTSRTFAAKASGVIGFGRNDTPASSTPWLRIAFSV
jgi:hypothetical protein